LKKRGSLSQNIILSGRNLLCMEHKEKGWIRPGDGGERKIVSEATGKNCPMQPKCSGKTFWMVL